MKDVFIAITAACGVVAGSAAFVLAGSDRYCPQPSAASVAALFAPCQALDAATGPLTKQQATDRGLLGPNGEPSSTPTTSGPAEPNPADQPAPRTPAQLVAEDHQAIAQEHATSGLAGKH